MTKTRLSAAECAKIFDFPLGIEGKTTKTGSCKMASIALRFSLFCQKIQLFEHEPFPYLTIDSRLADLPFFVILRHCSIRSVS